MERKYRVSYTESQEILTTICEVYDIDNSDIFVKFAVGLFGIIVMFFMFKYGNPGGGTTSGLVMFFVKYFVIWALVLVGAIIINRTVWRRMVLLSAFGAGEENYAQRMQKRKNPLKVKMDFYEDHFTNITPNRQREYMYENITKLIETDNGFGIKFKTVNHNFIPNGMMGFPKDTLEDADFDEFKQYLLEHCPKVRKIKKL